MIIYMFYQEYIHTISKIYLDFYFDDTFVTDG